MESLGFWLAVGSAILSIVISILSYITYRFVRSYYEGVSRSKSAVLDTIIGLRKSRDQLQLQVEKISQRLDQAVLKNDPIYREIGMAMKDALKEGEGLFEVREVDDSHYFFRQDPKNTIKRGPR